LLSETLAQQLRASGKPDPTTLETLTRLVSEAVGITRDLAKGLAPVTLERDGLQAALSELAESSSSLFGINCSCEFEDSQRELALDGSSSLHLFRIVQEAVNNSVRHGKAKDVRIRLAHDSKQLTMTVVDDGIGLSDKTSASQGHGLRIMAYRAKILHGSLTAARLAAKGGTVVTCICPLGNSASRS
jgi:signal transduction histidine kinase